MCFSSCGHSPVGQMLYLTTLSASLSLGEEWGFVMKDLQDMFEDENTASASVL